MAVSKKIKGPHPNPAVLAVSRGFIKSSGAVQWYRSGYNADFNSEIASPVTLLEVSEASVPGPCELVSLLRIAWPRESSGHC